MTRNRASAKAAGTRFATGVAAYLAHWLDSDHIERRALTGAKDRGDIAGVRVHGQRVVIETKDCARISLGPWSTETEQERINDGALVGITIFKRHGKGQPGDQWALLTVRDLVALIGGKRVDEDAS